MRPNRQDRVYLYLRRVSISSINRHMETTHEREPGTDRFLCPCGCPVTSEADLSLGFKLSEQDCGKCAGTGVIQCECSEASATVICPCGTAVSCKVCADECAAEINAATVARLTKAVA